MKMSTFTCQILVGQKHSYDGGIINISHTLFLSENSRPAWVLSPTNMFNDAKNPQPPKTWIPTIENMLEDALVMIGLYILKDDQLITLANQNFCDINKDFIECYDDIQSADIQELYKHARKIQSSHKIVISVFQGSSILKQLPILKQYQNDIEVCKSIYTKENSLWSRQFEENGALDEF
jgi:hypothetical protein